MKANPVYKREMMVSARSFRLALVLLIFNGILAMVALLNMYSTLAQVRMTAEIQYSSFMELYLFVAVLEFVMVIFIMPAMTAGSISSERERRTLDLMMTTKLTPAQVVMGKMMTSLGTMGLMIVSSCPILAMVFVYGGVTLKDLGLLFLCYTAAALFTGSLGMCCSAAFRRSTLSTVVSYVLVGCVVIGTYGLNWFSAYVSGLGMDTVTVSAGQTAGAAAAGHTSYLLLINPMTTFVLTMIKLTGQTAAGGSLSPWEGAGGMHQRLSAWIGQSIVLQVGLAAVFLFLAVRALTPKKGKR